MNIVGEGFPSEIVSQVTRRQRIHGSGWNSSRTSQEIAFLNSNTSWVKLVSSVDVTNSNIIRNTSLQSVAGGKALATEFILFNGTNSSPGNQRAGVAPNSSVFGGNYAYGIGGDEFGYRPMMGIQSAEIKHRNRGSIRTASVKVKAYNQIQFDIIDALYLRLGFSMLLEWGHSMYFRNSGNFIDNPQNSLATDFLNGGITYGAFLEKIQNQRIASQGNYDAMFAKVSNYHWSFLPDGSYDITIDLVSIGDVVEAFKINSLTNSKAYTDPATSTFITGINTLASLGKVTPEFATSLKSASSSTLGRFLLKVVEELFANIGTGYVTLDPANHDGFSSGLLPNYTIDALAENYDSIKLQSYIRLGTLLKFIQDKIMYVQSYKGGGSASATGILKFDTDTESNLMYITSNNSFLEAVQVSNDPRICMVNRSILGGFITGVSTTYIPNGAPFDSSRFFATNGAYGQIMNIYVNIQFILEKLEELKSPMDNKVTLIDFLNTILSSISGALGGVNKLEATIDETINTVIIRDANPLPEGDKILSALGRPINTALFSFIGYRGLNIGTSAQPNITPIASFIKDFSFKTEISPDLATMITVGATANSSVVGENSTAFSSFNSGLTDRFKEEVASNPNDIGQANNLATLYQTQQDLEDKFQNLLKEYEAFLTALGFKQFDPSNSISGTNILTNLIEYRNQLRAIDNQIKGINAIAPSTGFIPFNLSLTIDGLSGMKIYSKFFIDTDALPANYPKTAEFLIKNIIHKIENNKWTTTLESIVVSKGANAPATSPPPPQRSVRVNPGASSRPTVTITGTISN
jgi:predicted component of type VI protein secretion system